MSTPYQPGQHPDADQLSAFAECALPAHEREQTLAHLATCPHCRAVVALSMPPMEETLPAPKPARTRWLSGWRLVLPGAIAAPVLGCLVLFFLHIRKTPENIAVAHPQPALQTAVESSPEMQKVAPPTPPALAKPAAPAKTTAPAPTIARKSIENLPLQGRNFAPAAPVAGVMGGLGIASDQRVNNANNQPLPEPKRALAMVARQNARVIPMAPLPSSLPIASTAVSGIRVLALDTQSALFRSEDAGQHWVAVPAAWTGRVLRVDVAGVARKQPVAAYAAPLAAPAPKAQTYAPSVAGSATLSGTVIDATGAAIPGAVVTVASRTVKADASGHYVFSNLATGGYTLEASSPGFERLTRGVAVGAAGPTVADLRLSIGSVSQSVEVTSASSTVELISTPSVAPAAIFELTTASGERWISPDGQTWTRK